MSIHRMSRRASFRIGNQTAFSAATIMKPFEYAVLNGFDAFEWFPDKKESGAGWQVSDLSKEARASIRDSALDHNIRLSVHAPWQANPLIPEARSFLFGAVDLAADIGASVLNIHLCLEAGIAAYVEAILPLLARLGEVGIDLSMENTPLTGPSDMNELFDSLGRKAPIDAIQVGMCLDLGHANLCELTRNDYLRFIDRLDPQVPIIHAHLHENYGDFDSHLPLFTGPAGSDDTGVKGFIARMKERHFSGSLILEQWPEPPSLLNRARDKLVAIIGEASEPDTAVLVPEKDSGGAIPRSLARMDENDFAAEITRADRQLHSWRKKLAWVHDLLEERSSRLGMDQLVYLAIYFRFMGTGEIPFAEDGGHYRPSHHARLARDIQQRLAAMATPETALIIRKIYPWVPSYDSAFTRAEPLTRIRDIAHRNDIPQELKREIKTTLQNKLHRCAGPEDLVTSENLLKKIAAPDAGYSPAFVEEFKMFHAELKEFFNARSLQELLEGILQKQDAAQKELIRNFLEIKNGARSITELVAVLRTLTDLRFGFRHDLEDKSGAEAQELQMADIKLEDYCFVLMSRLVNELESLQEDIPWRQALQSVTLGVENLRLSGFDEEECRAIENDLGISSVLIDPRDHEQLIHLKAILDRAGRLAETYCNKILTLFPEKAQRLGRLLGVADHAVRVFAEADIRSHPVFQLSKLITTLLQRIRTLASLPPWDLIVPGKVTGRLVAMSRLEDGTSLGDEPVIALLDKVDGDEEVPPGVTALIVSQATPHLSHLAVRARQEGVVLAVCEDPRHFSRLQRLQGKQLTLMAFSDKVEYGVSSRSPKREMTSERGGSDHPAIDLPEVEPLPKRKLLALDEVTLRLAGGKAYGAKRLEELSKHRQSGFMTPSGLAVPFGVMEEALQTASDLGTNYRDLVIGLNRLAPDDFFKRLLMLQNIIEQLPVPDSVVAGVTETFFGNDRLMVRSSSNSEDLEKHAGAGLYESYGNIEPRQVATAVRQVWASLWTKRAAMSRKYHGIPHEKAHMAVLIQKMLIPQDLSFIMHTVNPINRNPDEAYVELAVGLGETLASGKEAGAPYRLVCHKSTGLRRAAKAPRLKPAPDSHPPGGAVRLLAFASFGHAIWPDSGGGLISRTVDYSKINFSTEKEFRNQLGVRLGSVARFLEDALGQPQDIEGLICGDAIYLVQSRPQQGEV